MEGGGEGVGWGGVRHMRTGWNEGWEGEEEKEQGSQTKMAAKDQVWSLTSSQGKKGTGWVITCQVRVDVSNGG